MSRPQSLKILECAKVCAELAGPHSKNMVLLTLKHGPEFEAQFPTYLAADKTCSGQSPLIQVPNNLWIVVTGTGTASKTYLVQDLFSDVVG